MRDPKPENITGEKTHSFEWSVDVGQVLLGLAVIYAAWKATQLLDGGNDEEDAGQTRR
jgi:hypothetical protein